jgi:hypothetical protein
MAAALNHAIGLMGVHPLGEFPFDFLTALGVAQQKSVTGGLALPVVRLR